MEVSTVGKTKYRDITLATEKQINYIKALVPGKYTDKFLSTISKRTASETIEYLLKEKTKQEKSV